MDIFTRLLAVGCKYLIPLYIHINYIYMVAIHITSLSCHTLQSVADSEVGV